jgi:16S rRNA (uracil1498-N3)-methyltransferase
MTASANRLFVRAELSAGASVELDRDQANYLVNVLRLKAGDRVPVFNGRDGEWQAGLAQAGKREWTLAVEERVREQTPALDLRYLFAPLKHGRLDYMVQKAVEMGAGRLSPVLTELGQIRKVNAARMEANAIEAAEQCGLLSIPMIDEAAALEALIDSWPVEEPDRALVFCDEAAAGEENAIATLTTVAPPLAVLVGPEGGFSPAERKRLRSLDCVTPIRLGPRILRADTAAVAALAVVQAAIGDWTQR